MNTRRILFALVSIACLLLILSSVLVLRLKQISELTNELIQSYSSLKDWQVLAEQSVIDTQALAEKADIVIHHLPERLVEGSALDEIDIRFLSDTQITTTSLAVAQTLEDLLVQEIFNCHWLQSNYKLFINLMQFLMIVVIICIGITSYFMGRRAQDYRLAPFPEANPNPVIGLNFQGEIIYINKSVERTIALYQKVGDPPQALLPKDYQERLQKLRAERQWQDEWIHSVSSRTFQFRVQLLPGLERIHIYSEDITEKENIRARNEFIAYHDPVCLLANRQRLEQVIDEMHDPDTSLTLVLSEIRGLAKVLSTQGLDISDQFAREYSIRLRNAHHFVISVKASKPVIFRLDTNLFGCLYFKRLSIQEHETLSQALTNTVEAPFRHGKREFFFSVSSGVASEPSSVSARQIIQRANIALHSIADAPECNYQRYDEKIEARVQVEHKIEQALRHAIEYDELLMLYQPQQDLRTGELSGFEALMRWNRSGVIESPIKFIPIAEQTGLIHSMGNWALREVLRQNKEWQRLSKLKQRTIAVNVSVQEFARREFVSDIEDALEDCGHGHCIQLEITESLLIEEERIAIEKMHRLKSLGFSLAIDDFGTGYSSFSYLSRFPIDKLKIDRSFIVNMANSHRDEAIVAAMINVAHQLGIKVIAEGVETQQQRQTLLGLGCDQIQGFWYGKPMSAAEATLIISEDSEVI